MSKCVQCLKKGTYWFFKNTQTNLSYNYCDRCGLSWKEKAGKLIEGSVTTKFLDETWLGFDLDDMIATSIYKDTILVRGFTDNTTIDELFCRCLRCNKWMSTLLNSTDAYECSNCGFEWEVIQSG